LYPLKQRLIGAAVLLALAVIILPELLKEPIESTPPAVSTEIPPRPDNIPEDRPLVISIPEETTDIADDRPPELSLPDSEARDQEIDENPDQAPIVSGTSEPRDRPQPDIDTVPKVVPPVPAPAIAVDKAPKPEPILLPEIKLIGRADTSPKKAQPKPAATAKASASGEWVVQVGSFSRRENAETRRSGLAAKFPTTVESSTVNGRTVYRVRVGPQATRAESERVRQRLQNEMGVTGQVMSAGG
jgi:DedD protein